MKTLLKNSRIINIASAMLMSLMLSSSFAASGTGSISLFDHNQTSFKLRDVHNTLQCEQCHVEGIFKNTPTYCSGCHAPGTRVGATPQPINHVQTTAACDTCHASAATFQVKSFNHMGVTGNCTSCHGGQAMGVVSLKALVSGAVDKSASHIPLSAYPLSVDCNQCHTNTVTFQSYVSGPALHAGIVGGCSQCHGGPPGASAGAGTIGTYTGIMAYNPALHFPLTTIVDCNSCHLNFSTFLGASYTHTSSDSSKCSTCHMGAYPNVVSYVAGVHIPLPSGSACTSCHADPSLSVSKPTFLGSAFHTSTFGITASAAGTCKTCHGGGYTSQNAQAVGATHIPTTSDCSVCHTDATGTPPNNTSNFTTFLNSKFHQSSVGNPSTGLCSTCHNGSYINEGSPGAQSTTSITATHIPFTGDCGGCHTQSNTGTYTSFLGSVFHQTSAGNTSAAADTSGSGTCSTCHNGSFTAQNAQAVGATHIPYTADCAVCHTDATGTPVNNTSNFTTFLNSKFHQATAGNPPTGLCSTCHSGSYLTEGAYSTSSVISNHVTVKAGADCVVCHPISTTASFTTFLGAVYSHVPGTYTTFPADGSVASPSCVSCHNGSSATGKLATGHLTTTGDCNSSGCHSNASDKCPNCLNFSGVVWKHTGTLSAGTTGIPYSTFPQTTPASPTCTSCHNGTNVGAQGTNSFASHVPVPAGTDCISCHTPADTGCGTTGTCSTFLGAKFNHASVTAGTCGTCHLSQYANVVSLASITNHIPQTSGNACDACHTSSSTGIAGAFPSTTQTFAGASFHATLGTAPTACSNCHNGTYAPGPSAYGANTGNAALGAQAMNSVSTFTHIATTADCIICHTSANTGAYTSSFLTTPAYSVMVHNSTTAPTGTCGTCHLGQYTGVVSRMSAHIPQTSGNACDTCHTSAISLYTTSNPSFANVLFHANSLGNPPAGLCSTCHSGTYAPGPAVSGANGSNAGLALTGAQSKSSVTTFTHMVTTADCVTCHTAANTSSYTTYLGAGYSHTATYPSWTTATTGFPATPASPTCASCHNGTAATGVNTGHPVVSTGVDCNSCHTSSILQGCPNCTLFGIPAGVSHTTAAYTAATGGCVSCHNGTAAVGLSSDVSHIPIGSISCAQCHPVYDGTTSINFSTTAKTTLTPLPTGGTAKYVMNHTGTGTVCGTSCHNGSYTGQGLYGAMAKTSITNHIPTTIYSTADCNGCHTTFTPNTNFAITAGTTQWSAYTMGVTQHNGAQGGSPNYCVTCHLSSATYLQTGVQKVSHNGASTSKDCSVSGCHKPLGSKGTSYTSWK